MFADTPLTLTMLALSLVFSGVSMVIGFAIGAWFFRSSAVSQSELAKAKGREDELRRATERAMMASQRIQDLAKNMVSDVSDHTTKVTVITSELQAIAAANPSDESVVVFATIGRIIAANNELQTRLEAAEKQIAAQAADLRTYENDARTDSLTGLANRRAFDNEMARRLAEWQRCHTPFALMILDIDHFKSFNDTNGHVAGDEMLRKVGKVLSKTARQMDLPCRYGGEEFAVILPSTEIQEARVAAERFRTAIESAIVKFEGQTFSVTASIGVACIDESDGDPGQLIRRADEAMYKSKEAGRNCGHWHDGTQCLPVISAATTATPLLNTDGTKLIDSIATKSTFVDILQRRITESHRFGIPLSVMYLRVVDFEKIQQEYGKSLAYLTLDSVAIFTQSVLREMDLLARLDDGEFMALLPGSTIAEANRIAQRLQATSASCVFPLQDAKSKLSVKHGLAELKPNETANLLMARAEAAVKAVEAEKKLATR